MTIKFRSVSEGLSWDFVTNIRHRTVISDFCWLHIWKFARNGNRYLQFLILTLPTNCSSARWRIPITVWAPSQYPKRRLFVRSREVSKPRDWYFKLSYRSEIWQAHRQQCCRSACQISERSDNSKYKSRGFETLRDLTERRLFGYWDGALGTAVVFT